MSSSSTTTRSNQFNQGTSIGTSAGSFTNPALAQFQTGLMSNIQKGMQQANQPLYGQGQVAGYLNNLNTLANRSIESLQGNLARRGGLSSGALTSGLTNIGLGRMGEQAQFMANVPLMNRQAQLQSAGLYGGLGNQLMSVAPRTQTTNQFTQGTGTGYQKQTYDPSIMSDIGQAVAIAGGVMGMPSSAMVSTPPSATIQGGPQAGGITGGIPGGVDQYMGYNIPGMGGGMVPGQNLPIGGYAGQPSIYSNPGMYNPSLMWNQQP